MKGVGCGIVQFCSMDGVCPRLSSIAAAADQDFSVGQDHACMQAAGVGHIGSGDVVWRPCLEIGDVSELRGVQWTATAQDHDSLVLRRREKNAECLVAISLASQTGNNCFGRSERADLARVDDGLAK